MSEEKPTDQPPPYTAPPPGFNAAAYPPPGPAYPPPGQQYPPPGQQYPPPGQQYPPPGQPYGAQGHGPDMVIVHTQPQSAVVVRAGNCPSCRTGFLVDQFTCCGILMAVFFFPIGLICCLMMRRHVCSNCGAVF